MKPINETELNKEMTTLSKGEADSIKWKLVCDIHESKFIRINYIRGEQ